MNARVWLAASSMAAVLMLLVDCRLIAGYEELELTPAPAPGGAAGTGGNAGTGGTAGSAGSGGDGEAGAGGAAPTVTITSLTATPERVVGAREVTLHWEVELADSCEFDEGLGNAAPYWGDLIVEPATTTTYTLTCQGPGGPASRDVTVMVLGVTMMGGDEITCARTDGNVLKCFGRNTRGQLGQGDTSDRGDGPSEMGDALTGVDLGPGHAALGAAAGDHHVCALLDDNNIKCWGANDRGQLGLGDTNDRGDEPGEMGAALDWVPIGGAERLALGGAHSCAILLNGSVKCWGANDQGQLGIGDATDRGTTLDSMQGLDPVDLGTGRTATAIAAGAAHSCALLDDGTVKCWGGNLHGQLGQELTTAIGDEPGEMGDALAAIDLGGGLGATAIAAGGDHSCALLTDQSVKCWGLNSDGQLGTGDATDHGSAPGTMGDALPAVSLGLGHLATAIAVGGAHSCAVSSTNLVKCWGLNASGQLGQGDTASRGADPSTMGDALLPVNLGAQRTVRSIALGRTHSCAVIDDRTVRCWGGNASGQLGLGDGADRGTSPGHMGESLLLVDITP